MKVSIGIIVRNEAGAIGALLESVALLEFSDSWELIIVDGHSTDGTQAVVTQFQQAHPELSIRLIEERGVGSHGNARNNVIDVALGEFIAFTDADCVVANNWLAAQVGTLQAERAADAAVVAVGGIRSPIESSDWKERTLNALLATTLGSGGSAGFVTQANRFVDSVGNYNAIYVGDVLREQRYLPLRFGEDFELNRRLNQLGYKIVLSSSPVVRHRQEGSFAAFAQQLYSYGRGQANVYRKTGHVRWFAPAVSLFWMGVLLGWLAALVWSPLIFCYISVIAIYLLAVCVSTAQVCRATRDMRSLITLAVYPLAHFTYGVGFLRGILVQR
ncbi:glycosyltransferase [Blastopirellula sp. J2-11]|uniref:glycosyltransferase n=1 Tax=Blastopirellula sp. J2-11 TaxID=2943192 RepID=UPI0021C5A7D6|nr:glycosyltransferase [Blastopirellula sp. J2-11]UUO06384.1 glycosyltransferase [Blastopirellula sp. J2-11]